MSRAYKHEAIRLFVVDDHVRIFREDGQLLWELTLNPSRDDQPQSLGVAV